MAMATRRQPVSVMQYYERAPDPAGESQAALPPALRRVREQPDALDREALPDAPNRISSTRRVG